MTDWRSRLYESYASIHAGVAESDVALRGAYLRDIAPNLLPGSRVLDLGCGQGGLVRLLQSDGHDAWGVDISAEQVSIAHEQGVRNINQGDFVNFLEGREEQFDAITSTDFLEHIDRTFVLCVFDLVYQALRPGGRFLLRVPNAVSPFSGNLQFGDFTHEAQFTARSVRQLSRAAGFSECATYPCPPYAHGLVSWIRHILWQPIQLTYRLLLAVETGSLRSHVVTQNLVAVARK